MATPEKDKRRAFELYMEDVPISKIAESIGTSRQTIYRWRDEGLLLDGDQSWDDYKERRESVGANEEEAMVLEAVEIGRRDFWDKQAEKIQEALDSFTDQLAEGEVEMSVQDAQGLYSMLRKMQNRGQDLHRHMERFQKLVYAAVFDVTESVEMAERIKDRAKEIEQEILSEFDPEMAKALINGKAKNIEVTETEK